MASRHVDIRVDIDEAVGRPGYARIVVPRAASGSDSGLFRLQRLDRDRDSHLGPSGWQGGVVDLRARETAVDGDALVLFVGPEIVDAVPSDINVVIEVPAAGIAGDVFWPDLPASGVASGQASSVARAGPVAPPTSGGSTGGPESPGAGPIEEPVPPFSPPSDDPGADTPPPPPDRRRVLALGTLALLLLAAAAAALLLPPTESSEKPPAPPPVADTPPCDRPYDYVKRFLADHAGEASAWYREADALLTGDCLQSGALLLIEAAENGSVDAMERLARLADPLVELDDRVLYTAPDPASALKYYAEAATAGSPTAATARERLVEHLRARAAEGDAAARDALRGEQ